MIPTVSLKDERLNPEPETYTKGPERKEKTIHPRLGLSQVVYE